MCPYVTGTMKTTAAIIIATSVIVQIIIFSQRSKIHRSANG